MADIIHDNFGFKKKCGILAAVSSLPSDYGIGCFGKPCYDFIDFLDECGQTCWQILPLNPTAYGDSPYQSPSAFAGNPYFIDLDDLYEQGLLTRAQLKLARRENGRVDYGDLFVSRFEILRLAYAKFKKTSAYYRFLKRSGDWVNDYALYMALKTENGYKPWTKWQGGNKHYSFAKAHIAEHKKEVGFWLWVQYEFDRQWRKVCLYAHKRGIKIIGDMPIYVALDSVDVWSKPENYLLDEDFAPTVVAGFPPDGFSPDGQLWGNPVYDWEKMEKDGFCWWVERVKRYFELYDILRIDHFRGFAGYYVVPYGEKTARNGRWVKGSGKRLFSVINKKVPYARIIAEDLGNYTKDVGELLEFTGYPGMKLLQFAFFDDDSENLPRMFKSENCVVYTGSHDADCTYSWCKNLSGKARKRFYTECPRRPGESMTYSLIRLAMGSIAQLVIIPMQDYLELSNEEGRMNMPSTADGNWTWRMGKGCITPKLKQKILNAAKQGGRDKKRK